MAQNTKAEDDRKRIEPLRIKDSETGEVLYTLEFNRESVIFAENHGFDVMHMKPMTDTYNLFYYAFRMHHRNMSRQQTDRIIDEEFGGIGGIPEGVIDRLCELYNEPFEAQKSKAKNARLTVEL